MAKVKNRESAHFPRGKRHGKWALSLFREAKIYIPGGVNSPVRSFKAVGGYPVFVKRASGSKIYSETGGRFIDYCLSWGAMILGHAHPEVVRALGRAIRNGTSFGTATKLETDLAKLIVEAMSSIEQVRLTSSGTEAVMSAIRLARAYTRKTDIIKFEGAYHGHADYLLARAGSGASTLGMPDSLGVPEDFARHTIVLPYNDLSRVGGAVRRNQKTLAAIIVEPVQANCGVVLPRGDFLHGLRRLADKYGALLIFDEVITGFRLSYNGAQGMFKVTPDMTCLGKIIGGGLPVGAFGGRREIMKLLAPEGGVYQAGTLSGNPIAVTAGITTLKILKEKNPYEILAKRTEGLCADIRKKALDHNVDLRITHIGSIFSIFFSDPRLFKKFFHGLLKRGVYLSPSGFETNFLSTAHMGRDISHTIDAIEKSL